MRRSAAQTVSITRPIAVPRNGFPKKAAGRQALLRRAGMRGATGSLDLSERERRGAAQTSIPRRIAVRREGFENFGRRQANPRCTWKDVGRPARMDLNGFECAQAPRSGAYIDSTTYCRPARWFSALWPRAAEPHSPLARLRARLPQPASKHVETARTSFTRCIVVRRTGS
ncbi:hypothetical protein C8R46DRAFT_293431 [Mycena filopes]|nr:hypothetical protein C8R46DRAFT_293431 [Mycena filopes]